jgi:hypothetical protein
MICASLLWRYARAVPAAREHDVVEVDRLLAERGDVDDPRRRRRHQPIAQQRREQEPGEVVDREAQLVAVRARRACPVEARCRRC